ncbi:sensor domain-containing protein [Amycolatopsis cihanbeyliensis]|uniref:Putative sensor protein n=1 Tax=Amycolatopsis cihanbeyliensis TaxID=1128664 RepID=A0A542DPY1_AMYCI|nr:sensor domain-containing protein [Amycolatopsis cihanbeyliensis]TQJ05015.1 putative sensor protein [Amycolatopsis cihanbeyliensis]
MTTANVAHGGTHQRPPFGGSLAYLLMNMPLGIGCFVTLVTLSSVGLGTAIIWVGIPVLALGVLLCRGGARVERARVYALLDTYIPIPYRPLPEGGQKLRWRARLRDEATWRDLGYLILLFPLGLIEFVLVVTIWSVSLGFAGLPIYYRFLPEGAYYFPSFDLRWITVDSTLSALPWAALGVLFIAMSITITRSVARTHASFANVLLGPSPRRAAELDSVFPQARPLSTMAG